ncbi:hypothetical protein H2200_003016 [Cladophialophora chaetospira]|uniref:Uncharacterized protein n=1 Tax=Cladophialophora chaetospira TaxID=386627 RepID=A0AA38XGJ4_9EURO|nr:hypothetical protein H2200_003016 [Cladophialophora chaetospira]
MPRGEGLQERFPNFTRIGDSQYYRHGQAGDAPVSATLSGRAPVEPDLIIFCSWAAALPKHIQKYLAPYQALYPRSDILLLESSMKNLAWVSDAVQIRSLRPAVSAVNDLLQTFTRDAGTDTTQAAPRKPTILVHVFSNGGAHSIVQLAQAFLENALAVAIDASLVRPQLPAQLPISALILDSSPGRADYKIGIQVVLSTIPKASKASLLQRSLATLLAHIIIASVGAASKLGIAEDIASKLWRCLNDVDGPFLLNKGASSRLGEDESNLGKIIKVVPRTYIYSNRDEMVPWQCVVAHADEARKVIVGALSEGTGDNGHIQDPIRLEGFAGSAHVAHATLDPGRYWKLVRETIDRAC